MSHRNRTIFDIITNQNNLHTRIVVLNRTIRVMFIALLLMFAFMGISCAADSSELPLINAALMKIDLFSASFPTTADGWACGRYGKILHTSDSGQTWEVQNSGTDNTLTEICFIDDQTGWAVGENGTIIKTCDGGNTWMKQKSPVNHFLMGAYFVSNLTGWIVTEQNSILNTEDGGHTWKVQFSGDDYILKSVSFCDPQNGWAVGEYGYIYHTSDGGQTWNHQAGFFDISEEDGDIVGGTFLYDVWAIDPKTAWVAGMDGYVAETTDAGLSWTKIENLPKVNLFCIAADGKGGGIVGGRGALLVSTDDLTHFVVEPVITPPVIYGWVYDIKPLPVPGSFVTVGKGGWIYFSKDNGKSWTKKN